MEGVYDAIRNSEVLEGTEAKSMLCPISKRQRAWIGSVLRREGQLKSVVEGKLTRKTKR